MADGRARTFLAAAFAAVFMTSPASAQENRPIKITSPYTSGSGPDVAIRMVTDKISQSLNQPVIVEPRPGGNGFIALPWTVHSRPVRRWLRAPQARSTQHGRVGRCRE